MKVPFLDLRRGGPELDAALTAAFTRVLESGCYVQGPEVERFEDACAAYLGVRHAIGVSSGTDALLVVLMALGVGPGDEVIVPTYSFFATAGVVARLGALPILVDVRDDDFGIDPAEVAARIGPRTRAIVPVHLFGQCADMDAIRAVAGEIPVIEDAAQAIGARVGERPAGGLAHAACFSFFPSKNLGAFGDAGAVVLNDATLAARIKLIRSQGQEPKYFSKIVGGNFRLDALQAAVLRAKLPHLDQWTAGRQRNAATYRRLFAAAGVDLSVVRPSQKHPLTLPREVEGARHIYNQFCIRSIDREGLRKHLNEVGIGNEIYYPRPMHLQECFASWGGARGQFPEAEAAADESLAIPIYPELNEAQLRTVVDAVLVFHKKAS